MSDQDEIRALQIAYCELFDARDADNYAALYTEDTQVTTPWGQIIHGREKMRKAALHTPPGGWHKALDSDIHIDGDNATGICRFQALAPGNDVDHGYYEDTYRRTADGWKFASRKVIVESAPSRLPRVLHDAQEPAMTGIRRFAVSGGIELIADAAGPDDGAPVLFIPGGGQRRHTWRQAIEAAAAHGFRAYSLDLRGHGDSGWSVDADYRIDRFAQDLREVAAALGGRPAFVGASLGGVSSAVAIGEPPHMPASALVLVDVAHRSVSTGAGRILGFMREGVDGFATVAEAGAAIHRYLAHRPAPPPEAVMRNLRRRADGKWTWHWDPGFVTLGGEKSLALDAERIGAAIAGVTVPTMLIRGGSSEIVTPEIAEELRAFKPDIRYLDIPGATHMVAGDDNDAFTTALLDFLKTSLTTV